MAETMLKPNTVKAIHQILEPIYNGSIGWAATWADEYRRTPEGAFSTQWHWIDSSDQVYILPQFQVTDSNYIISHQPTATPTTTVIALRVDVLYRQLPTKLKF